MLTLLALLGFMGIAVDFGHLFVVKTELQTAADSCALAAVQELDGSSVMVGGVSDALTRATRAGKTAGNLNKVNFQGAAAGLVDADVTFSDALNGSYSHTFSPPANAKYAKCTSTKGGMAPWLLQALTAVNGNTAFSATQGVKALAVATTTPSDTACAIPVQIRPKTGGTAPNYGYTPGEWIPSLYSETGPSSTIGPGQFGWANLDGSTNATATRAELLGNGYCNLKVGDTIGTSGVKFSAAVAWNSRFGLYRNGAGNPAITNAAPDTTGYSYTNVNWPSRSNAVGDFLAKRADFRSYGNLIDTVNNGNTITGLNVSNAYNPGNMGTHALGPRALAVFGASRRLVLAPIVAGTTLTDWACVLMLAPIDRPTTTIYLEFVGNATVSTSPCASLGKPGGTNGPLVPALVE